MTPTCKLAHSAGRDLQEVSDYWTSEAGEKHALQVVGGILETLMTIAGHPGAGVVADRFGAGVRKFPAGKYMIYYRPYSKGIEVLHVFHGARDQKKACKKSRVKSKRR
jgi:toxin ParE1/3/4